MSAKPVENCLRCCQHQPLTPMQKCAIGGIVTTVALLVLGSLALVGIYSQAGALSAFGNEVGDLGAYLMLGIGAAVALVTLVLCCRNNSKNMHRSDEPTHQTQSRTQTRTGGERESKRDPLGSTLAFDKGVNAGQGHVKREEG